MSKDNSAASIGRPSAAAHTPGPWWVEEAFFEGDDHFWIHAKDADGTHSIACVRPGCEEASETGDVVANARLIAATPDGYALAEEVIRVLYEKAGPENEHLSDDEANLWHQARAFMSKVHGMEGR